MSVQRFPVRRSHRYVIRWRTAAGGPFFWYEPTLAQALVTARRLSPFASYQVVDLFTDCEHDTDCEHEWRDRVPA
jgi:hypothetical protein